MALLALGGCASGPEIQTGKTTPAVFKTIPDRNITTLRKNVPTEAIVFDVLAHPDAPQPLDVHIPGPAGTMTGSSAPSNGNAALADSTLGLTAGGPIGGILMLLGAATAYHDSHPAPGNVREGVMPVLSEPTLDLFRPLTPEEQAIPLKQQKALFKEEVGLIMAIRDGHEDKTCQAGPCAMLLNNFKAGEKPSYYSLRYQNPTLLGMGDGGIQVTDKAPMLQAPAGVPIGDNGFIGFGIDAWTGWANVLPGLLPDNAYWSQDKMAALLVKYPPAANWYAVFNTPVQGGKPGEVLWTVMKGGKVVSTARLVTP
jgi:hypothetical protein